MSDFVTRVAGLIRATHPLHRPWWWRLYRWIRA